MEPNDYPLFDGVAEFPQPQARRRFAQLVGLDSVKARLVKQTRLLLNPHRLESWSEERYGKKVALVDTFQARSPFFILAGDVGTGKTTLAESFGDSVARADRIPVRLFRLSLSARGSGAVGEITKLLSSSFQEIVSLGRKGVNRNGKVSSAIVFLIDEADALAQSREFAQMHHEDRAGVNALIRGIDDLATAKVPVVVIMCTNRLEAIDPAVRRRAAALFELKRPSFAERLALLRATFGDLGFTETQLAELATVTGSTNGRVFGYTYSDISQRLLPEIVLDAFPDEPVHYERALSIAQDLKPTPPFSNGASQ